jgi:hypothetical protein
MVGNILLSLHDNAKQVHYDGPGKDEIEGGPKGSRLVLPAKTPTQDSSRESRPDFSLFVLPCGSVEEP